MSQVEGWLTEREGRFLASITKGLTVLEIGSYKGKSTNYIAPAAYKVFCIDTFKAESNGQDQNSDYTTLLTFLKNTKQFTNVFPLIGKSESFGMLFNQKTVDVLFIDGDHSYEGVKADFSNFYYTVKDEGCICFHDYTHSDHVRRFVDEIYLQPDLLVGSIACIHIRR